MMVFIMPWDTAAQEFLCPVTLVRNWVKDCPDWIREILFWRSFNFKLVLSIRGIPGFSHLQFYITDYLIVTWVELKKNFKRTQECRSAAVINIHGAIISAVFCVRQALSHWVTHPKSIRYCLRCKRGEWKGFPEKTFWNNARKDGGVDRTWTGGLLRDRQAF